jgi:hypothetical protein
VPIAFEKTNKFLNSREWRTFLSAASSASYPDVVKAVRAGHAWLSAVAFGAPGAASPSATHSGWVLVEGGLAAESGETLGI